MSLLKILDRLPLTGLIVASLALGLAPFAPMPHLLEKILMLAQGTLERPIDIFDLFMHGSPVVLLGAKLLRMALSTRPLTRAPRSP